ncbi:MAG: UvrD-helicase domain-containing protein [Pseudomonadota bacterium]
MVDVLQDASAREQALDVYRSFIVQAPAGSGKTSLLTRRFLRLLAIVKRPEEILAITFTRKAAAEMRLRIVEALQAAATGHAPTDDHSRDIFHDAERAMQRDRECGWSLLSHPMRLQIMTVDAFNSRLVTATPIRARAGGIRIAESDQQAALYASAADSLLEWLTERHPLNSAARRFYRHLDGRTSAWRAHFKHMLSRRERWLPILLEAVQMPADALRAQSENILARFVQVDLRVVDELFPRTARRSLLDLLQHTSDQLAAIDPANVLASPPPAEWPGDGPESLDFWRQVNAYCQTKQGTFRKRADKTIGLLPADKVEKASFKSLLGDLANVPGLEVALAQVAGLPDPYYADDQWVIIESLLTLLPALAAELEQGMQQQSILDYPALAARAINALGDPQTGEVTDLALRFDYRISHILVDEMQDTSASQYRLLAALTAGWSPDDGRSLFCVGDPMQSIYRFRGADVSLFLQAWREGIGQVALERLVLETNFRSDQQVIDWVNATFAKVMGTKSDATVDRVAYSASVARPEASQDGAVSWHVGIGDDGPTAESVVALVRQLREEFPGDSIGILSRARAPMEPVLAALNAANIACEAVEMDRLTELPEVIDLLLLTRVLAHGGDKIAWLGLLRSPLIGLSLNDIDRWWVGFERRTASGASQTFLGGLQDDGLCAHLDLHTRTLLARFVEQFHTLRQQAATLSLRARVETLWCRLGGPTVLKSEHELDNAWRFLDALESLEDRGQLDDVSQLEHRLDDARVTRSAPGAGVYAMTIFKSKGLEFDHVVLPDLQRDARRDDKPALYLDVQEINGATGVLFSADSPRATSTPDYLHDLLYRRDRERRANELDRLLYVACTRARKSLHLFASRQLNKAGDGLLPARASSLLHRLGEVGELPFATIDLSGTVRQRTGSSASAWIEPKHRQVASVWQPSLPGPLGARDHRFESPASRLEIEFDWAGDNARHVGTVVHEWLYRLAGEAEPIAALSQIRGFDARTQQRLGQLGVPRAQLADAVASVQLAVEQGVHAEIGQWILANDHADSAAELPLAGLVDGRVVRVVIDRILRDERGYLWIIDYKTSQHEGGGIEAFFLNESERYTAQLLRYRQLVTQYYETNERAPGPIKLALYFPRYGHLQAIGATP